MNTQLYLDLVEEFHRAFQYRQPTPTTPSLDDETCALRVKLVREEFMESGEANCIGDMIGLLDGLCDLQYVTSGAVLAFGVRQQFTELMPFVTENENPCGLSRAVDFFERGVEKRVIPVIVLALCRIEYSLHDAASVAGFTDIFDRAFREVHRANMSKLWTACEMESWIMSHENHYDMRFDNSPAGFIAKRADGKIIKSPSFVAPDLGKFIQSMYAGKS